MMEIGEDLEMVVKKERDKYTVRYMSMQLKRKVNPAKVEGIVPAKVLDKIC